MRNKVPHADWMAKGRIKDDGVQWTEYPSHTFEFHFLFKKKKHVDVVKVQGCKLASRRKLLRL